MENWKEPPHPLRCHQVIRSSLVRNCIPQLSKSMYFLLFSSHQLKTESQQNKPIPLLATERAVMVCIPRKTDHTSPEQRTDHTNPCCIGMWLPYSRNGKQSQLKWLESAVPPKCHLSRWVQESQGSEHRRQHLTFPRAPPGQLCSQVAMEINTKKEAVAAHPSGWSMVLYLNVSLARDRIIAPLFPIASWTRFSVDCGWKPCCHGLMSI